MPPVALVTNVGFKNKGDALMARAIMDRLVHLYDVAFPLSAVVSWSGNRTRRPAVLMSDLTGTTPKRVAFRWATNVLATVAGRLPHRWRSAGGYLLDTDPDMILDLSGYAYGDPWGPARIVETARTYRRWASGGARIVLMPKTWGPFETIDPGCVHDLLEPVSLAFARDERSLLTLRSVLPDDLRSKVAFAPDYTHAVAPLPPSVSARDAYAIVPSFRMIDSGAIDRDAYVAFLAHARSSLLATGKRVVLVLHETANDLWFRRNAGTIGFPPEDVIALDDERQVKGLLGQARGVLTSRLHGLYNALNAGVPVLVAAWSFKYREALRQYGCERCLLDLEDPLSSFDEKLHLLTSAGERERLLRDMAQGKAVAREGSERMWAAVLGTG